MDRLVRRASEVGRSACSGIARAEFLLGAGSLLDGTLGYSMRELRSFNGLLLGRLGGLVIGGLLGYAATQKDFTHPACVRRRG